MWWLNRRLRSERGATAVLVGILMVPLLGCLAIALDVGAVYVERAQLQNGADAAALAIAQDCAHGVCSDPAALAASFANDNANDGAANVLTPTFPNDHTVTVSDSTRVAGTNADAINHPFAKFIGVDSTTVHATATAEWGPVGNGPAILPLALSYCDFLASGSLTAAKVTIFYDENKTCKKAPDTGDIPGGFGWLTQNPGTCEASVDFSAATVPSEPGNSQPSDCDATLQSLQGKTILIPIFDSSTGTGSNGVFHLYAFAAFKVTGWKFAGGNKMPYVNVDNYAGCKCTGGNDRFIQGYFQDWVSVDGAYELGGHNTNAIQVRLIK